MQGLLSPQAMNPAFTIGGTNLYPLAPQVDPSRYVYKPTLNRSGLLDDTKANNLIKDFAGGLLNGYQYNPNPTVGNAQITPTTPSGVYTADPGQGTSAPAAPGGGLTYADALRFTFGMPGNGGTGYENIMKIPGLLDSFGQSFGFNPNDAFDSSNQGWADAVAQLDADMRQDRSR